jgi:aminoglycoside phosphotransferase (APT) family kinase protein
VKGRRLGAGASAEVFEWGEGRVVKLFRPRYRYAVRMEADRARAVHAAGVSSPEVFEVIEHDGRLGIVFERIEGEVLLSRLRAGTDVEAVGRRTAELRAEIHRHEGARLPSLLETVESNLDRVPDRERSATLARHLRMPAGCSIYHGDFHPGNVIESATGPVIIDWVNAFLSHPAADVARSIMLMRYQGLDADTAPSVVEIRRIVTYAYVARYLELTDVTREEISRCEPAMAAALLRHQPGNAESETLTSIAACREVVPRD